jgi:hypothetical protein
LVASVTAVMIAMYSITSCPSLVIDGTMSRMSNGADERSLDGRRHAFNPG